MSDRKQDLLNLNARIEQTNHVLSVLRIQRSTILAELHAEHFKPADSLDQESAAEHQEIIDDLEREYDEIFEGGRR